MASGGSCGSGALSGAAAVAAAPVSTQIFGISGVGGLAINSIVGGLASVAGGGKFENGAVTGAD